MIRTCLVSKCLWTKIALQPRARTLIFNGAKVGKRNYNTKHFHRFSFLYPQNVTFNKVFDIFRNLGATYYQTPRDN